MRCLKGSGKKMLGFRGHRQHSPREERNHERKNKNSQKEEESQESRGVLTRGVRAKRKKETSGSRAKGASFNMSSYKQQICDSPHRLNDKHLCSTFLPFPSVWLTVESVTTSETHFVDRGLLKVRR